MKKLLFLIVGLMFLSFSFSHAEGVDWHAQYGADLSYAPIEARNSCVLKYGVQWEDLNEKDKIKTLDEWYNNKIIQKQERLKRQQEAQKKEIKRKQAKLKAEMAAKKAQMEKARQAQKKEQQRQKELRAFQKQVREQQKRMQELKSKR